MYSPTTPKVAEPTERPARHGRCPSGQNVLPSAIGFPSTQRANAIWHAGSPEQQNGPLPSGSLATIVVSSAASRTAKASFPPRQIDRIAAGAAALRHDHAFASRRFDLGEISSALPAMAGDSSPGKLSPDFQGPTAVAEPAGPTWRIAACAGHRSRRSVLPPAGSSSARTAASRCRAALLSWVSSWRGQRASPRRGRRSYRRGGPPH